MLCLWTGCYGPFTVFGLIWLSYAFSKSFVYKFKDINLCKSYVVNPISLFVI